MSRRVLAALLQRVVTASLQQKPSPALAQSITCFRNTMMQSQCSGSWIATSGPRLSSTLAAVLGEELKHENKEYQKPDIVASGPPAPFKLQEVPGETLLTLTRDYQGEKVSVDLQITDQPEPEDYVPGQEDDVEAVNDVAFNVAVSRGDTQLVFECTSDGNDVHIQHVSHELTGREPSDMHYSGPVFSELDEEVIREFREFLAARGIDADLGEYLRHLVSDKEQREYTGWLKRVQDFAK